jgi:peroxiredoxin
VGVSADHPRAIAAFVKEQNVKHLLLGDFRRTMLPLYDAMVTDPASPIFRYGKRAYYIIDRQGTVRYMKVLDNPLNLLSADEVLAALKTAGT